MLAAFIDILIEHEDLSSAATWLGELAARAADAPETIALEARLALAKGDKAADALDACRDSLGGSPDFVLQEARLLELRERPADAEQAYRRLLDDVGTPTDLRAAATARLAWCLMDREQASEAFTPVDRAIVALGPAASGGLGAAAGHHHSLSGPRCRPP